MNIITLIVVSVIVAVIFTGLGIYIATSRLRDSLTKKSAKILVEAEEKAEMVKKERILQAKEKFLHLKTEHENKVQERNTRVMQRENRMKQKEQELKLKVDEFQKKYNEFTLARENLNRQLEILSSKQSEVEKAFQNSVEKLEQIAGLSAEDAKKELIEVMTGEARSDASSRVMEIIEEAKLTANQQAKKIVVESIQRTATENAIENTVSVFNLENEEIKGRIIGREGRNIRTLEIGRAHV